MPIIRWDEPNAKAPASEKIKNWIPMSGYNVKDGEEFSAEKETEKKSTSSLKTPLKRKREEKKDESEAPNKKRMEWLHEKARGAVLPTEKDAVIKPEYIFRDNGPLVIHVCADCRKFNSERDPITIGEGMVQLPLALCTICRAHFNSQRSTKFFQFELPVLKKTYNL